MTKRFHSSLLIRIFVIVLATVVALTSATALAQSEAVTFNNLTVELWPEYDRQEVLVIYRARLDDSVPLPASVTFRFPPYLEEMHAIAQERNGGLFSIGEEAIAINRSGDAFELTLTVDNPDIHLEYYDPAILTRQGEERLLDFNFSPEQAIEIVTFQVQEPLQTQEFILNPPASGSFTDRNGFTYYSVDLAGLAPGDSFQLSAAYTRETDQLSTAILESQAPAQPESGVQLVTQTVPDEPAFDLGYILIGAGAFLLLATGGYWWWSQRSVAAAGPIGRGKSSRPTRRKKKRAGQSPANDPAAEETAGFCYNCGTPLRADANFCHNCGAKRRKQ